MVGRPVGSSLKTLLDGIAARWPDHDRYVERSFASRDPAVLDVSEALAENVLRLAADIPGGLDTLVDDYRFVCEEVTLPEEIHFRRHGTYRLTTFEDAERECYSNAEYMNRYMNGLLVSDIVWSNHAHAFASFVNDYLPRLKPDADHLEIGPGHGMFLYFAARAAHVRSLAGWDVSPTSIRNTRHALETLGVAKPVNLTLQNLFAVGAADAGGRFDSIVMSEILEHLENPVAALQAAAQWLRPGGLLWINVPANSPAPDHIFLVQGIEHARAIAAEAGLEVIDSAAYPMSGATLEKAVKHKLAVSCVVTARKPD
jgi:2-polyprenyl-3-methyl-5-hydroxy-6-metoxy-1,4-benzoquinol methylase